MRSPAGRSRAIPRYHFHVRDGVDRPDRDGFDLPDIHAARAEALELAGEIIREAGMRQDLGEEWRITVADEDGLTLFIMDFLVAEAPAATRHRPRDVPADPT